MTVRGLQRAAAIVLGIGSLAILASVNWKIALGVMLFGWAVNIDNGLKRGGGDV